MLDCCLKNTVIFVGLYQRTENLLMFMNDANCPILLLISFGNVSLFKLFSYLLISQPAAQQQSFATSPFSAGAPYLLDGSAGSRRSPGGSLR